MLKIYLTGITGHMGFNLARELVRKEYNVVAGVRNIAAAQNILQSYLPEAKNITLVKGDLQDEDSLVEGTKGVDCIINAAAIIGLRSEQLDEQLKTNIEGVRNLLEAAVKNKVKRFIQISTIQTFKSGTLQKPTEESDENLELDSPDPYAKTKIEADKLVLSYQKKGLDPVILSLGLLLGPYDLKGSAVTNLINLTGKGYSIFYFKGGITVSDVEDVAKATVTAISKGKPGERYILGGANISFKQIFEILSQTTGCPSPRIPIPNSVAYVVAYFLYWMDKIFNIKFIVNSHRLLLMTRQEYYSSAKAQRELGLGHCDPFLAMQKSYEWITSNLSN